VRVKELKLPWKLLVEWISEGEFVAREIRKVYKQGKTPFQEYLIAELANLGKTLIIDGKVQSSLSDEYWYHEALVHPILLAHPCPEDVLVIG
jgi:spermidine synthase